jgi:hypothetical protein
MRRGGGKFRAGSPAASASAVLWSSSTINRRMNQPRISNFKSQIKGGLAIASDSLLIVAT